MKRVLMILLTAIVAAVVGWYAFQSNTLQETPETAILSDEVKEEFDNARDAFWLDNDPQKSYQLQKELALAVSAHNASAEIVTDEALKDETNAMLAYAEAAKYVSIEESLRLYAEIYNNTQYPESTRAEALFKGMEFVLEKIGAEMTVDQVRSWVFADNRFGSILSDENIYVDTIDTKFKVYEMVLIAFSKAEKLSTSSRIDVQIIALSLHLELELATISLEEKYALGTVEGESISEFVDRTDKSVRTHLDELFNKSSAVESRIRELMNDRDRYSQYERGFVNALNDLMNAYTLFQYHGYDIYPKMISLNVFIQGYTREHEKGFDDRHKKLTELQNASNGLVTACSYVHGANRNGQQIVQKVAEDLVQPFLELSVPQKKLLSGLQRLSGQKGVCYEPYVLIGKQSSDFQKALIAEVGGWTAEQFK